MRTIKMFFHVMFSLIGSLGPMRKIKSMDKKGIVEGRDEYVYKTTTKWAKSIIKATGSTVEVIGAENLIYDRPVVYIGNHLGIFDIPVLMSSIKAPIGFIAKIEMEKVPVVRDWMKFMHSIFMDRANLRKSAAAIIEGVKTIKAGHSMVIFPEGTRSKDGKLLPFKAGSFKLATKSKAPIIPFTIIGTGEIYELNGKKIKPSHVTLYFHPAIETKDLTKEEQEDLHNSVRDIVASKLK